MTTIQTMPVAIEMVINAGLTTAEDIFQFVMDKGNKVTVPMIEEALLDMVVAFKKKDAKETKASFFARALEMDMDEYVPEVVAPAVDESPAADIKSEEEVIMEELNLASIVKAGGITEEQKAANRRMLERSGGENFNPTARNVKMTEEPDALHQMLAKVNAAKDQYVRNVGEHAIIVESITFYPERKEATREEVRNRHYIRENKLKNGSIMRFVGEVTVRLPEGYAQIKIWNKDKINSKGKKGAPEFVDFVGVDVNLAKQRYNMRKGFAKGTGLVTLSIYEFVSADGTVSDVQVSLPTEKGKDGTRYPIFQTSDVRYIRTKDAAYVDEPLYVRDNNEHFNAQVTAMVQLFINEFRQAHPDNHNGYDKTNCVHMVRFGVKDGVSDDLNTESKKNRVILEQPDVMQLASVGSEQPNTYCMVKDEWLDLDAKRILNEAERMERGVQALDAKDDELRYQRHDEIVVAGKLVKRNTVVKSYIEKTCAACPFYCGNSPKSEAQVAKEKAEAPGMYVNPFYRERPKANAQAVQTLVVKGDHAEWVTKYPYEALEEGLDIIGVRVKGAGMTVYASDDVLEVMDPEYVVPVEEFDARHANVMKLVNQIFHAAFNLDTLTEEHAEYIFNLEKPEDITESESKRWDMAIQFLAQSLVWAEEREAARNIKPFARKFFQGRVKGAVELPVDEVMGDTMYRAKTGQLGWGLGYEDLNPTEFVRYLDEVAMDKVYEVIKHGTAFSIVQGEQGTKKDVELAAGALQEMLQRELGFVFIKGVRRDADPEKALATLGICKEVKDYIHDVVFGTK